MGETVARIHSVAAEINALYALRSAAEEALRCEDFNPLRRALEKLSLAEKLRRGTP